MVFFLTFTSLLLYYDSRKILLLFSSMLQIDISQMEYSELVEYTDTHISDFGNFDLCLTFKADYNQSKIIRDLILLLFQKNNIEVPWKNRFALISDELVNNSIEYGSLPLDKNHFTLHFETREKVLTINMEVSDTGR